MRKPKSFEGIAEPSESSQLSSNDYQQMMEHAEHCPSCREVQEEFLTSLQQLPSGERDMLNGSLRRYFHKTDLRARFLKRACAEGIRFSPEVGNGESRSRLEAPRWAWPYAWATAAAGLAVIAIGIGYRTIHTPTSPSVAAVTHEPPRINPVAQEAKRGELEAKVKEIQTALDASNETLAELRNQNAAMALRVAGLERDLGASQSGKQALQQTLAGLNDHNAQLASQNEHSAQLLARARSELEEARSRQAQMEADLGTQKAELTALVQQMKSQTATLTHDRELLAAGRDITDLMGARNLHIIDVHDADGKGKNQKAFGRIFYTEGKSLIFYAYDLDAKKMAKANYSFDVWGERLGEPASVRNLGILYTDDKDQKRWMLSVDDPQQLAEIDSLFVTLESHGAGTKPLGQRVLFAFLGGRANHP